MWVFIIFFMCIHCDTVICSRIICECLLYFSCVFTVIQLYVAELYVSVNYIFHMYSLWYSYMQPNFMWVFTILFMWIRCDTVFYPKYMWVFIILFMFIQCDTIICSLIICECLKYFSCVFTVIQLHVPELYVSVYYIFHGYSLRYIYM